MLQPQNFKSFMDEFKMIKMGTSPSSILSHSIQNINTLKFLHRVPPLYNSIKNTKLDMSVVTLSRLKKTVRFRSFLFGYKIPLFKLSQTLRQCFGSFKSQIDSLWNTYFP